MQVELKKQPEKYLDKCTRNDYDKINKALIGLEDWKGDIRDCRGAKTNIGLNYRLSELFLFTSKVKI